MIWRRCVVLIVGSILGLLLYLGWRLIGDGTWQSLLFAVRIASRLGCTGITFGGTLAIPLRPPDALSTK